MSSGESFEFTIPTDVEAGQKVQEHILNLVEQFEYGPRQAFGIRLALEEAVVNAIRHGNQFDPEKQVLIEGAVSAERIRISVQDEGPGFALSDVPDPTAEENLDKPSGRGIMLMRTFMTSVEYNEAGNRVTIIIDRDGLDATSSDE